MSIDVCQTGEQVVNYFWCVVRWEVSGALLIILEVCDLLRQEGHADCR